MTAITPPRRTIFASGSSTSRMWSWSSSAKDSSKRTTSKETTRVVTSIQGYMTLQWRLLICQPSSKRTTGNRTGTGPFMAIELLVDHLIPCHRYRYGLESFFYVMIWFCTGFNPRKHHVKPIDAWQAQAFRTIGTTKGQFFEYDAERKLIWARAEDTGCLELCMAWSDPIITMLRDVFQATILINLAIDGCLLVQSEDLNREIEAEREYVASLARTREEALTYEKFMDALR